MTASHPPRLAGIVLSWLLPSEAREYFLGDLEEGYFDRARAAGPAAARRWYWMQLLTSLAPLVIHRACLAGPRDVVRPRSTPKAHPMEQLLRDLRVTIRSFLRTPLFTGITLGTLALGIGAATAIFSVVNPILFESAPYPDADRVMMLWERSRDGENSNLGFATFTDVERDARSFDALAAMSGWSAVITEGGEPEQVAGQAVSHDFFRLLGIAPMLGRDFTPADDVRGQHRVAILSHHLWQRRFAADSGIVGRSVDLGGVMFQVIGVLPATFENIASPASQIWRPLAYNDTLPWACRTCRHLRTIARLRPSVSRERAETELQLLAERYTSDHPTDYPNGSSLGLISLQDEMVKDIRQPLMVVLGAVICVLLIACANVANLLLGRMVTRQSEFALRAALGASRRRLTVQVLLESGVLSFAGGVGGVLVALAGVQLLVAMSPGDIPRLAAIRLDGSALAFALGLAILTGLMCGVAPVFAIMRGSLRGQVAQASRTYALRSRHWTRRTLVIAEVALALVLLAGAGLLIRSLGQLLKVDTGFDTENLLTLEVVPAGPEFQDLASIHRASSDVLRSVAQLPGVTAAAFTSQIPLGGNFDRYGVAVESRPLANPEEAPAADRYAVTPDYVRTMRIPLLAGRDLSPADDSGSVPVALINQELATRVWGEDNPLGDRIRLGGPTRPWRTVVGVVGNVRHVSLAEPVAPQVYVAQSQWGDQDELQLVIRATTAPAVLTPAVRGAIRGVSAQLGISEVATMDELIRLTTADRTFALLLFQLFAGVALVLAGAGVYAVIAGSVAERRREIGIRAAMGATRGRLVSLVVGEGMQLAGIGLLLGIGGALFLARWIRSMLYGVGPGDPVTFVAVALLLALVAITACLIPAWRAARTNPVDVLRSN
jgi:putative ABC transport system permease protein